MMVSWLGRTDAALKRAGADGIQVAYFNEDTELTLYGPTGDESAQVEQLMAELTLRRDRVREIVTQLRAQRALDRSNLLKRFDSTPDLPLERRTAATPETPSSAPARYLDEDQLYHRGQILAGVYPLIHEIESYADFEIDDQIRVKVSGFERRARGAVKGRFPFWANRLCSDDEEEERILAEGSKAELLALVKSYTRVFDNP